MEELEQEDVAALEGTIDLMESSQLCLHPLHLHSFAQVTFLLSGSMRQCAGCENRLRSVLGYANEESQVLRCVACGLYAHRTCAMSSDNSLWEDRKCQVNLKRIQQDTMRKGDLKLHKSTLNDEITMVWTNDGPPRHWAGKGGLKELAEENKTETSRSSQESESEEKPEEQYAENNSPMQIAESTFANVARAIQENVLDHFRRGRNSLVSVSDGEETTSDTEEVEVPPEVVPVHEGEDDDKQGDEKSDTNQNASNHSDNLERDTSSMPNEMKEALLKELKPEAPPRKQSTVQRIASGTIEAARTSSRLRQKLKVATVWGGIAGGVAGLVMAGPLGAVAGVKYGQSAGVLSVVLEGSVTVGILVAGAAAGSFTACQIQQQAEQRILTIGEQGSKRKVLLVRPHIWIDPSWDQICEDAKRTAPAVQTPGMLDILTNSPAKQAETAKKKRYEHDSDIVKTADFELPMEEKVLLLVSRILNDKFSLPGHVYRALIQEHRRRSQERKLDEITKALASLEASDLEGKAKEEMDNLARAIRSRRLDAHAVIKHVTATLLEVRPGFASSPDITEMSATAVEGLVFGELYHSVFEEILIETWAIDEALMAKLSSFDADLHASKWKSNISQTALNTLALIPEAHVPVDKLRYAVIFLERISDKFSSPNKKVVMGADSLLKMVCLHLVLANVPRMNAELAFLEEYARDERLLRGKEGYALVTLQASLHFLNASSNFENDIFLVEDDNNL